MLLEITLPLVSLVSAILEAISPALPQPNFSRSFGSGSDCREDFNWCCTDAFEMNYVMSRGTDGLNTYVDKSDLLFCLFLLVLEMHHCSCSRKGGNPPRETLAVSVGSAAQMKK